MAVTMKNAINWDVALCRSSGFAVKLVSLKYNVVILE
jgi:hypothetical protein